MFWIFAAVVLVLACYHPGFRRVFLWALKGAGMLLGVLLIIWGLVMYGQSVKEAQERRANSAQLQCPPAPTGDPALDAALRTSCANR